eukprot:scpid103643/ scgid17071/ Decorin; Bone proteoglycan II; PG-S2
MGMAPTALNAMLGKPGMLCVWALVLLLLAGGTSSQCDAPCKCRPENHAPLVTCTSLPTSLPADTSILVMEGASISHLPPGIFSNLTTLSVLYLHNNSLSFLPDGVFVDLIQLSILHLGRNILSALEVGVFDSLHNLRRLHLGRNSLSSLQVG